MTSNPAHGAYQLYTACSAVAVSKLPSSISFVEGCVVPVSISTAVLILFKKETLGLPLPSSSPSPTTKCLLIGGGSSSVGASAIQLAVGTGAKVITVASKHNIEKVKELGASAVFDYNSPTVIDDIIAAAKG